MVITGEFIEFRGTLLERLATEIIFTCSLKSTTENCGASQYMIYMEINSGLDLIHGRGACSTDRVLLFTRHVEYDNLLIVPYLVTEEVMHSF